MDYAEMIKKGAIFLYPTDTVCGLGCSALSNNAVARLLDIKGRENKPLSLAFYDMEMVAKYTNITKDQKELIEEKLPGPYTFIVRKNPRIPDIVTAGLKTVGVRIPNHEIRKLIKGVGTPIITTSANKAGEPAPARLEEVSEEIREAVDFVFNASEGSGRPSKIVDLTTGKILRQ